jgi:hypothetical protein
LQLCRSLLKRQDTTLTRAFPASDIFSLLLFLTLYAGTLDALLEAEKAKHFSEDKMFGLFVVAFLQL